MPGDHMSTRRQFLTSLGAGVILGKLVASGLVAAVDTPLTKEALLRELISTEEGREKLAAAMVQPVRTNLRYDEKGNPINMMAQIEARAREEIQSAEDTRVLEYLKALP